MERKKTPQDRYEENNIVRVVTKLGRNTDADILDALESCANRQGYIKALIRNDLEAQQKILKKFQK